MKSVRLTLLCMAAAVLSACSTPFCDAPGGLCSPQPAKTSLPPPPVQPPAPPLPPKAPPGPDLPPAEVFAVTMPGATAEPDASAGASGQPAIRQADTGARFVNDSAPPSGAPVRIGLLLPLRSDTLGAAAESVRAGFMAGLERDRDNITVTVVETGDVPQDILGAYARALQDQDIVVGPLSRTAVAAVAGSSLVSKPTIALNYPEGHGQTGAALPPQMLAIGLSIEEEARQAAQWAAADQPSGGALVLTTSSAWQRRVATAFANQWEGRLGRPLRIVELSAPDGYLSDPELVQLRARLRQDTPAVLFSAMGADQTRQLRIALGSVLTTEPDNPIFSTADKLPPPPTVPTEQFASLPIYGTSALNPGAGFPGRDLEGVRLLDLPWQVQRDHPAVMVYPRSLQTGVGSADMARLYALGIDAFRVAREIARHPAGRFQLDGVTGKLTVDFGQGPASFERVEQPAIYQNGAPQPARP